MPVYVVTGKLGGGKTLAMVARMIEYLDSGRRVATNIDLNLRKMLNVKPDHLPVRLPDIPTMADLRALGSAHTTCREELNGAIVLDECGTWLNSRAWSGKERQNFIDWLLHSRKRGWDVFFVVQAMSLLDKQIRDALAEYVVVCRRLDRMRMPMIGGLLRLLSGGRLSGNMPKAHVASVFYGLGPGAVPAFYWRYRGLDLYEAYSSAQLLDEGDIQEEAGPYSLVWHETPEEVAARHAERDRLKPKLPQVLRLMLQAPAGRMRVAQRWEERGLLCPI